MTATSPSPAPARSISTAPASIRTTTPARSAPGTLTVAAGGFVNLKGTAVVTDGALGNSGTIDVTNPGNALHNVDLTNTATGIINVLTGGDLVIDAAGTLINAGDINITGTAEIDNDIVTNTGTHRRGGARHADPGCRHRGQQR